MSLTESSEIDAVLDRVRAWPATVQLSLATRILESLEALNSVATGPRAAKPLQSLLGLLSVQGTPPSDEECRAIWIEERLRKLG